jgi:hypothetical protein
MRLIEDDPTIQAVVTQMAISIKKLLTKRRLSPNGDDCIDSIYAELYDSILQPIAPPSYRHSAAHRLYCSMWQRDLKEPAAWSGRVGPAETTRLSGPRNVAEVENPAGEAGMI